jgi:predicted transcriptional regulator
LRELAVTLKKIGITAAQCAVGCRAAMMMNKLGVKEDGFESFMADTYDRCKNLGLTSENIASYLIDLLEFSRSIPFTEIPNYIDRVKAEKKRLKEEIESLHEQKEDLEAQKSVTQDLLNIALHDEKMTTARLKWYSDIKKELSKYGVPVDDIQHLAKLIKGIREYGFDTDKVLDEFSNQELLKAEYHGYREGITRLKDQHDALNRECSFLQQLVLSHNQSINTYQELENMGFGLKELKLLWHTISEVANANNIPPHQSVQKFIKDVEEQYDDKLGLESKINMLRGEVDRLSQEENSLRAQLLILPLVAPSLTRLRREGVSEQDIIDIAELLKCNGGRDNSGTGVTTQEMRSLIAELRRYGSIKSTISHLNQNIEKLKNQVNNLRIEKKDLNAQNRAMSLALQNLKQIASFFSGSSMSMRNEIIGLVSIISYITYSMNLGAQRIQSAEHNSNDLAESDFAPLAMAAKGEVEVDLTKLKFALKKAIDVIQKKLDASDSKLDEVLSMARLLLSNEQM